MFDHLKNRLERKIDRDFIHLYPYLHYRPRKKAVLMTVPEIIKSHIYSYTPKKEELSRWDYFLIHSRLYLINLTNSSIREIKHYSRPKNMKFLIKRILSRIKESLIIILVLPVKDILEECREGKVEGAIYVVRNLDHSDALDQLNRLEATIKHLREERKLPNRCSDCGLSFENRWRHPEIQDKHLICAILKD